MSAINPLSRSQYYCNQCDRTSFKIFAKSTTGRVILCSQNCFDQYRLEHEDEGKKLKWYMCFPINASAVEKITKKDMQ